MPSGTGMIGGNARGQQIAATCHQYTDPTDEVLDNGMHGPDSHPSRGIVIAAVGGGELIVDTYTENGVVLDITNLEGVYLPVAVKRFVSAGGGVKVIAFW